MRDERNRSFPNNLLVLFLSQIGLERQAVVASDLCSLHASALLHISMLSRFRLWVPGVFVVLLFLVAAIFCHIVCLYGNMGYGRLSVGCRLN